MNSNFIESTNELASKYNGSTKVFNMQNDSFQNNIYILIIDTVH